MHTREQMKYALKNSRSSGRARSGPRGKGVLWAGQSEEEGNCPECRAEIESTQGLQPSGSWQARASSMTGKARQRVDRHVTRQPLSSGRWECAGGAARGPFWVWISGRDAPSRGNGLWSPVTTDARERTLTMPPPPLWWASLDRPSLGSLALSDTTAATQRLTLATVCCAGEEIW